jgi:FeoC like transcriptional regulator
MLTQLLALLAQTESGLTLAEMGQALSAQPSAVFAMVEMLVRKGRIIEIGPDGGFCASCGLEAQCHLLTIRGKRYVLRPRTSPLHYKVQYSQRGEP